MELGGDLLITTMFVGAAIVCALLAKVGLDRLEIPALIGYMIIGVLIAVLDSRTDAVSQQTDRAFALLAELGVICLLFRVGLESKLRKMVTQLGQASFIWIGNVLASGGLAFLVCRYLIGLHALPSLVIGVAMAATSIGIPCAVWEESGRIDSRRGQLFLDVAELDDISGVVLMAVLFSLLPVLRDRASPSLAFAAAKTAGIFAAKLAGFILLCVAFSRYAEERITRFFKRFEPAPDPVLMVVALGILIAALAGLLGFSAAIGAFFAGLVFSRDPDAVRINASFAAIYAFFAPFFFVGIGMQIRPEELRAALPAAAVLLAVAAAGKFAGTAMPALKTMSRHGAIVLGVSMIPRAEITMIIMQRALELGGDVITQRLFSAMVIVSALTCIGAPWLLHRLLRRSPIRT